MLEIFNTAELENYFRDECVLNQTKQQKSLDIVSSTTAIVYPFILPDRLEILVSLPLADTANSKPAPIKRYSTAIDSEDFVRHIKRFRQFVDTVASNDQLLTESQ